MFKLTQLNAKERKKLLAQLDAQFGCGTHMLDGYALFLNEKSGRLSYVNEEVLELDLSTIKTDTIGCYLGTRINNGEIRLSIEGSQLVGPHATKNVLAIDDAAFGRWMHGEVIAIETDLVGFLIMRRGDDFCGCGKVVFDEKASQTVIHNYVSKTRWVHGDSGRSGINDSGAAL